MQSAILSKVGKIYKKGEGRDGVKNLEARKQTLRNVSDDLEVNTTRTVRLLCGSGLPGAEVLA